MKLYTYRSILREKHDISIIHLSVIVESVNYIITIDHLSNTFKVIEIGENDFVT